MPKHMETEILQNLAFYAYFLAPIIPKNINKIQIQYH